MQIIKETHCVKQYEELNKYAVSFLWKIFISEYHKDEISDAFIRELSCSKQTEYIESLKGIFSCYPEKSNNSKYKIALFKSEAHLIAFAQNFHSLSDICAHIITYSTTKMNGTCLGDESKINLYCVKDQLKESEMINLKHSIIILLESKEFKYLSAFVNTIKHKEIISTRDSIELESPAKPSRCLKIEAFDYKNNHFDSILSTQLIEEYCIRLNNIFCTIFKELGDFIADEKKVEDRNHFKKRGDTEKPHE